MARSVCIGSPSSPRRSGRALTAPMTDRDRLEVMMKAIDEFKPSGASALGGLVCTLESQFDLLSVRSAKLERSFHDFWNAGEVLFVSRTEDGQAISQSQWDDITKRFLPALRAAIEEAHDASDAAA